MRRSIVSTALASALCVSSAAAAGPAYLKFEDIKGEATAAASDKPRIAVLEIQSWSWGASQSSASGMGGGMGAGKVSTADLSATSTSEQGEAARKRPGKVKYADITLKRGNTTEAAGGVSVAAGDLDGDGRAEVAAPRDAASGLPTGKRQHKPMKLTMPLERGSVNLTVKGGWADCRVGASFPALELGADGTTYRLSDAVVTRCARGSDSDDMPTETVSLNYTKITY